MDTLNTGVRNVKNVANYIIGKDSFLDLRNILLERIGNDSEKVVFFIDIYFYNSHLLEEIKLDFPNTNIIPVDSTTEPTTSAIDAVIERMKLEEMKPEVLVAIGGGCTLDTCKAVSNLWTNGGQASQYQGWDLVKKPGLYKIAVPTISGTGAEATRTCVMTNTETGLKLGMNSDFTVFDYVVMDPELTSTVPRQQFFYTGMDAYIHCIESIRGNFRNPIGDSFSEQTLQLCRDVFNSSNMKSDDARSKLMVASYLGGCAIATSYVGLIHPLSAGLSVVLGIHHCEANCIAMRAVEEFYPEEYREFWGMVEKQKIHIRSGVTSELNRLKMDELYDAMIVHEKPLYNALGEDFNDILTKEKVFELYRRM